MLAHAGAPAGCVAHAFPHAHDSAMIGLHPCAQKALRNSLPLAMWSRASDLAVDECCGTHVAVGARRATGPLRAGGAAGWRFAAAGAPVGGGHGAVFWSWDPCRSSRRRCRDTNVGAVAPLQPFALRALGWPFRCSPQLPGREAGAVCNAGGMVVHADPIEREAPSCAGSLPCAVRNRRMRTTSSCVGPFRPNRT